MEGHVTFLRYVSCNSPPSACISLLRPYSFYAGALTVVISILCFFLLGTPREVRWLVRCLSRSIKT